MGKIAPIDRVRFLVIFTIPIEIPQLLPIDLPNAIIHLGFRAYSMMFTSTVVGLVLGVLYTPRSWCGICPINTLTKPKIKSVHQNPKATLYLQLMSGWYNKMKIKRMGKIHEK